MRYAALGFCFLTVACSGNAPTAPTVSTSQNISADLHTTVNLAAPLKGTLEATEAVTGNLHHLDGGGNGTAAASCPWRKAK